MRIIIAGPGRAGGSLAIAATRAGHSVIGFLARDEGSVSVASLLDVAFLSWNEPLPPAELLVIAVRDDAIAEVAERVAPMAGAVHGAVHLSGLTSVAALEPLAAAGLDVGGFHPLQTLPDPMRGADALAGAHVGVTAGPELSLVLEQLAINLGLRTFSLDDELRAVYHAAAAVAANYVVATLDLARRLFEDAGVDFGVARPLVEAIVANVFEITPSRALTGPIARGDTGTVQAQMDAIREVDPELAGAFMALGRLTADLAGTEDAMAPILR